MARVMFALLTILTMARVTWTNTYLAMSHEFAVRAHGTECWVCTGVPTSSNEGFPLVPIPLNLTERLAMRCFSNSAKKSSCLKIIRITNTKNETINITYGGPTYNDFEGWYTPPFKGDWKLNVTNAADIPRLQIVKDPHRPVNTTCFCHHQGTGVFLGNSTCMSTQAATIIGPPRPVNGTYFVCGSWAYPWLPGMSPADEAAWERLKGPHHWTGCCYVAYVVPRMRSMSQLHQHTGISKRSLTKAEQFFMILFLSFGSIIVSRELITMASALETLANATAISLSATQEEVEGVTAEMVAIRTVVLQNRMALDFILAEKGGTCAIIDRECCTFIPDASSNITNLAAHIRMEIAKIRKVGAELHGYSSGGGWWPFNMFGGTWGMIVHYGLIVLLVVLVICLMRCLWSFVCIRQGL
ncbi:ERV-BabFcenv provirus ancestral Env polyprotein-like [Amblyraja radiata]|uniref:ERV-BabFcenv provirus ancestral Env polyprotein-like n=1 Tax=Amblyraja radiata TaxID=386614 RepID=UPI0014027F06|nr:ERV-BabFcenv provirus ancestral Env polyprotein-like [Amblyraja radiata]